MQLPNISLEQVNIINRLSTNNNVVVEAVAGSGKTTANLYIAKNFDQYKILLLTYNAKLKIETREKVNQLNITNLEIHSYHSFCVKYYNSECINDIKIINMLKNDTKPNHNFNYDLIILDEAQDITPVYFQLIHKIFNDNNNKIQICLLGDRYQSIYDFNKADARFMIYADKLFKLNTYNWICCNLTESFRITKEMSDFINNCMMNKNHIVSNKITNIKPTYIICNSFTDNIDSIPIKLIKKYFDLGYKSDDIFILAPSIKSIKSPVRSLENILKKTFINIPIYVPVSDEEKLDQDILDNKLVFSTFHQVKGLERKIVIIYNFDESYFTYFKNDADPLICPNELYVATTRATEHLIVLHHYEYNYLNFININNIKNYCNFIQNNKIVKKHKKKKCKSICSTKLIQHLPIDVITKCLSYLEIKKIKDISYKIDIPLKIKDINGYENVSEITGTAIPAYLELINTKKMTIFNEIYNEELNNDNIDFIDDDDIIIIKPSTTIELKYIKLDELKINELLYIANKYCSKNNGYLFKTYQITNYDWLSQDNLDLAINKIKTHLEISNNAKYESYYEYDTNNIIIKGIIDCIDNNNIYEFKCTKQLENEHILQLAIYMFLYESNNISEYSDSKTILINQMNIEDLTNKLNNNINRLSYINNSYLIKKLNQENITLKKKNNNFNKS